MPPDGFLPLVGRSDELALVLEARAAAADGRGTAWLVTGEAGVGKSRLLSELRAAAEDHGALVLQGGCFDTAGELIPYGPFLDALRDLPGALPDDDLRVVVDELMSFFLGRHDLQEDPAVAGRYGRTRAFELALDALTRLGTGRGVVLLVEDLHWVDQSSLDLLAFVARSIPRRPVLLVLSARQDELQASSTTRRTLLELVRAGRLRKLSLHRLPEPAMGALVDAAASAEIPAQLRQQVLTRSEGNPFFALELLASVEQTGRLAIPETVRESVLGRVAALPPEAKRLVRLAAAGHQPVAHETLEASFGSGADDVDPALRQAVEADLLRVVAAGQYTFGHALVRDVVYDDMLPGERRRCHEALAQGLTTGSRGEPAGLLSVAEEAHHWYAAGRWPEALRAAARAGQAAERSSAYPEAAEQYGRALGLWDRVEDPERCAGRDRLELAVCAADATRWAGHPDRALAIVEAELAARADDPLAHGSARLLERAGRYRWELGDTAGALSAYEESAARLADQPPSALRANALAARATGLILLSRFREALRVCDSALQDARAAAAPAVEAHVLATAGVALAMTGRLDDGIDALRQARAVAERTGDVEVLCRAYSNLSWVLEQAGRVTEALAASQDGVRATAARGLEHTAGVPLLNNAASQLALLGRWDEAERLARDCLGRPGMARFAAFLHLLCAETATGRGDLDRAEQELAQAEAAAGPRAEPQFAGPLLAVSAELALWRGRPDLALAHVTEGLGLVGGSEHLEAVLRLCAVGARALADARAAGPASRREEEASGQQLLGLLSAELERVRATAERLPQVVAWEATLVAELSRLDGADPEAWAAAAELWRGLGFPYHQAYAGYRLAEALAHRRALAAAAVPLGAAVAAAHSLRAKPLLEATEALCRRAGVRLPTPTAEPGRTAKPVRAPLDEFGLTARERDVLRALAEGRTNRQIARQLFITEKTTEIHVSRVLAKLGVRNRLEAATLAHTRRLLDAPPLVGQERPPLVGQE